MKMSDIGLLAEEYGNVVYGFCVRLTGNTHDADELYQNTFLKALEKASSIDADNNPKSYLISIAISLWKSHRRKFARRAEIAPMQSIEDYDTAANSELTEDSLLKNELYSHVNLAVGQLEDKLRLPIVLHYTAQLPLNEIAALLKIPEGTVKSRLHTARQILKQKLEVYENGQ